MGGVLILLSVVISTAVVGPSLPMWDRGGRHCYGAIGFRG
jgi:hypothetical protein